MESTTLVRYVVVAAAAILLALMVEIVLNPWALPRPGEERQRARTGIAQRVLLYRFPMMAVIGLFLAVRLVPGGPWAPLGADVLAIVFVVLILIFPVRYYFTDVGFSLQSGRFYRWNEFQTYRRAGSILQLQPAHGRAVSLYLNEAQQQAVLPLLRRYVSQRTTPESEQPNITRARPPRR